MEALLAAAAAAMNAPGEMVMRSARARAAADGIAVEAVLGAWGGGAAIAPAAAAPAAAAPTTAPAPAAPAASGVPATDGPAVEVVAAEPQPEAAAPVAEPEPAEDLVSTGSIPRWLVALFIIVPVFAIAYALFLPNGPNCGDGGRLAVDPVTGLAVNCDGSEYGVEVIDFFSIGEDTYASCTSCHGASGGGSGNFPAFTEGALLATFPTGQCSSQVEWIGLGTRGWPDATYGDTEKMVGGSGAVMPSFGGVLTDIELQAVAFYERVTFGNEDFETAFTDCGLDLLEEELAELAAGG